MNKLNPAAINLTPHARLEAEFKSAEIIQFQMGIPRETGIEVSLPDFDFFFINNLEDNHISVAIFLPDFGRKIGDTEFNGFCESIYVMIDRITQNNVIEHPSEISPESDTELIKKHKLLLSIVTGYDKVVYNRIIYLYSPVPVQRPDQIQSFFEDKNIRIRIRDLDYYQQQWDARRPDVFISHDSADKASVAEPLYYALTAKGLKVWLDKYALNLGDSLTEKINEGIAECRYGVLILSKAFLANERWAKRELNSFSVKDAIGDSHKLIPVWHGISEQDLAVSGNYWLIDKLGGNTGDIQKLADDIARAIAKP